MSEIKKELGEAIETLDGHKKQYPKMSTKDVIDMLKRLYNKL